MDFKKIKNYFKKAKFHFLIKQNEDRYNSLIKKLEAEDYNEIAYYESSRQSKLQKFISKGVLQQTDESGKFLVVDNISFLVDVLNFTPTIKLTIEGEEYLLSQGAITRSELDFMKGYDHKIYREYCDKNKFTYLIENGNKYIIDTSIYKKEKEKNEDASKSLEM